MNFESQDPDSYTGEDDRKRDSSRKREGKRDKKEKGYQMFEEEDSDSEQLVLADEIKSPSKVKKERAKPSFKFPVRKEKGKEEKKDKESKKGEKEKRREEKEGKKHKKEKKNSKHVTTSVIVAPSEYENPIFGVPLATAVERNKSHDGIELPAIVRECIDYIEECGLPCEGIYRISGVKSKVQHLKDCYNRHELVHLYEHEPNIVASLLKLFLRDLPEPVLTTALMPKFEEASVIKNSKKKVEAFTKHIADLPICNRLLLSWMIVHMTHVIQLAKENKMTLQNVSIVLSPTMQISHRVLNVLFSNAAALFGDVTLRKYVPPLKPAHSKWSLELPDNPSALEEELAKQESLLNQLHVDLNSGLTDPVIEEQLWEVQRVVTQLKRKIKTSKKNVEMGDRRKMGLDMKKSSTSSIPSLSAPEELQLQLKSAPAPEPIAKSVTTVTAVVEKQPGGTSDVAVELVGDCQKGVKFAESAKGKEENKFAEEEKKVDSKNEGNTKGMMTESEENAKGDVGGETKNKDDAISVKKDEKTVTERDVSGKVCSKAEKSTEDVAETAIQAVVPSKQTSDHGELGTAEGEGMKEENSPLETQVGSQSAKDTEEVCKQEGTGGKDQTKEKLPKSDEESKRELSESSVHPDRDEPRKAVDHAEKGATNSGAESQTEKQVSLPMSVRLDTEKKVVFLPPEETLPSTEKKVSFPPCTEKASGAPSSEKSVSSLPKEEKVILPASEKRVSLPSEEKINLPPSNKKVTLPSSEKKKVSLPPFMSTTPLKPVKAEIPKPKCHIDDESSSKENQLEAERLRMLEEELLGEAKKATQTEVASSDKNKEVEEFSSDDEDLDQLLEEEYALQLEEEELLTIADELKQKIATEASEMERLTQEIQELQYLRQDSDLEDLSSSSNSSDDSEDEDDLQELLTQLIQENEDLELRNTDLCQKIHEERMICLSVKLQIRLLQQKQLESSYG